MPQTIPLDMEELNRLVEFWDILVSENSKKRTGLTSGLIPVREYTGYSGMEAWLRWPDILARCDEVMEASELGAKMRGPGTQTTNAHPFALVCIPFGGWRALEELSAMGLTTQVDDVEDRVRFLMDYWIRWVEPWRGDGFRSCWDAADTLRTCDPEIIDTLYEAAWPVEGDGDNRTARRFVAGLQQYLFLLYLDTRLGTGDTGPYPLPNGRHMIVREFSSLAQSWIPWSHVAADVPYQNLVVGLVFRPGIHNRVNDLSTTFSVPADNLAWLEAMSVFEPRPGGELVPVDREEMPEILAAIKRAQGDAYRLMNTWTFEEKVRNGTYVYFRGLMWPFTNMLGIDDEFDWSIPHPHTAETVWPVFAGGLPEQEDAEQVPFPMFPRLKGF